MSVDEIFLEMFHSGMFRVFKCLPCGERVLVYGVESDEQTILFNITEENWERLLSAHNKTNTVHVECGCVYTFIVPNSQLSLSDFVN